MSEDREPVRRIDRYELHAEIARGGMARVHLGRLIGPVGFSRTVAIKSLHPGYANDADVVRMFIDEARLSSCVRHPNVVPTLDVLATGGELFLVMEYVRGASLAKLAAACRDKGEPMPLSIAVSVMIGVLSGLHAAHEAVAEDGAALEIVHRDVSPQNVIVGDDGIPRVLDFGIAKAVSRLEATATGQIKGKLAYMSPEQLSGKPLDRRSDIFSASIVFWEILTNRKLFQESEPGATTHAILNRVIRAPSEHNPEVPAALDAIVLRGLSRPVEERPETAREMAEALEALGLAATPSRVGEFVYSVAKTDLDRGAELVSKIETMGTSPLRKTDEPAFSVSTSEPGLSSLGERPTVDASASSRLPSNASSREAAHLSPIVQEASSPREAEVAVRSPRSRAKLASLGILVLLLFGGALFFAMSPGGRAKETAVDETLRAPLPSQDTPRSLDPPVATASLAPIAAASVVPVSSKVSPSPTHRGAAGPRGRRLAPHPDCRILNADGTFGYRPECLK